LDLITFRIACTGPTQFPHRAVTPSRRRIGKTKGTEARPANPSFSLFLGAFHAKIRLAMVIFAIAISQSSQGRTD
jgi:hypothetical protein